MSTPMTVEQIQEKSFLEMRAKILDIAAYLDRLDRCIDPGAVVDDPRTEFLLEALELLKTGNADRARRILELYSLPVDDKL